MEVGAPRARVYALRYLGSNGASKMRSRRGDELFILTSHNVTACTYVYVRTVLHAVSYVASIDPGRRDMRWVRGHHPGPEAFIHPLKPAQWRNWPFGPKRGKGPKPPKSPNVEKGL